MIYPITISLDISWDIFTLFASTYTSEKGKDFNFHGLWNPEVQCHIHKGSPIIPILSRINPIPRTYTYLLKVHSNIVLPSTPI